MFKLLSVLALATACSAASLKVELESNRVLPFVDSSLPIEFADKTAKAAPAIKNLASTYAYAVDLSGAIPVAQLTCLRQQGYAAVFVRAYNPAGVGSFDTNSCTTIQNAYTAGLGIEIYITPQPSSTKQGYQQLDEVYQGLNARGITVRSVWIQVTSPTNWPSNQNTNIVFINSIVSRARQYGLQVGIYTSYYDWNQITNGWTSVGSDVLLWYWNVLGGGASGESPANFSDFRSFGCWATPSVKQFAQVETVCSLTVNRDVYLTSSLSQNDAVEDDGKPVVGFIRK